MEYHQEFLDRATGRLETKSIGEWITVTELGQRHGVGPRKVRAILHHMGVLAKEGRSYRLPRDLVETGIGRRHDKPKSGHAFDVISPEGQRLIDSMWSETVEDYEADYQKNSLVQPIRDALAAFKTTRTDDLGAAGEVRWIEDHFPGTLHKTIAEVLEVSPALVTRHMKQRAAQLDHCKRFRGALQTREISASRGFIRVHYPRHLHSEKWPYPAHHRVLGCRKAGGDGEGAKLV